VSFDVKRNQIKKVEVSGGARDNLTLLPDAEKPGLFVLADVPEKRTPDNMKASVIPNLITNFAFQDVRKATKPAADARRMVAEADDGLQLILTAVGELTGGWVQITAEATKDAAKDKATLINSKVEGYDFRLRSSEADRLGWTMTDLSREQKG
jgi:hypothetical protein